ncbi:MAG: RusA family crossover junction endodeoxyribonuclease [Opitutus sp.]|nr:RusA family crossover junction endodeoxyribonuclease [Opitutus sp.]
METHILLGSVVREPRVGQTKTQKDFTGFTIKVDRKFRDQTYSSYHECISFGEPAQTAARLREGDIVQVWANEAKAEIYQSRGGEPKAKVTFTVRELEIVSAGSPLPHLRRAMSAPLKAVPPSRLRAPPTTSTKTCRSRMARFRISDLPPAMRAQIGRGVPGGLPRTVNMPAPAPSSEPGRVTGRFVIQIAPMGKPRMTRRDKWAKRPCVVEYFAYADALRAACPGIHPAPTSVSWTAYFPMPTSWSQKKQAAMAGKLHRSKPDRDNVDKGILDALWEQDSCIARGSLLKLWDDGKGPRIELTVESE